MARPSALDRAIEELEAELRAEHAASKARIAGLELAIDRLRQQKAREDNAKATKGSA